MSAFFYWLRFNGWLLKQAALFAYWVIIFALTWLLVFLWALTRPWMTYSTRQDWLDALKTVSIAGRAWERAKRNDSSKAKVPL